MDRLSALDASFLYGETPESPMHVAGLAIFEPPPAGSDVFAIFRDHLTSRLHLVPFFERKLALTPIQLDHPVWVHDGNLDLDYHFRHVSLPKPGTLEQLETLVARLHMILLDRTRPLWQYYVIEGLEGGGFAIYIKMHHAGIDGGAGMAALPVIFATSPDPEPAPPPLPSPRGSRIPEIFELISDSYAKFFTQQREFFQSWPDLGKAIAKVGQRVTADLANPPRTLPLAPKTLFNVSLSSQRSFGTCTISLRDVKAVAKLTKSKVNDIVMTISAGALRRYLEARNALPDAPLLAAVPVSLRKAGNAEMNNQVTAMLCSLATDIADPIRRLEAIVASSTDSKKRLEDIRDVIPTDMTWLGAPIIITGMARLMGAGQTGRAIAGNRQRPDFKRARTKRSAVLRGREDDPLFSGLDSVEWQRPQHHRSELSRQSGLWPDRMPDRGSRYREADGVSGRGIRAPEEGGRRDARTKSQKNRDKAGQGCTAIRVSLRAAVAIRIHFTIGRCVAVRTATRQAVEQ